MLFSSITTVGTDDIALVGEGLIMERVMRFGLYVFVRIEARVVDLEGL